MAASDNLVKQRIEESIAVKQTLLTDYEYLATVEKVAEAIIVALKNGNKVMFFGNGGSAADAQHLAAEFTGRYLKERDSLAGMALSTNSSSLSAIGNDYAFDQVFARQLQGLGCKGDIAFGITTSGNSGNVLKAMEVARAKGILAVGLTGAGGKLREAVDYCICIPTSVTPRIQEAHILTGHIICELVENSLAAV